MKKAAENYAIRFFSLLKPIEEEDILIRSVRHAVSMFGHSPRAPPANAEEVIAQRRQERHGAIAFEIDTTNRVGAFEVQIAVHTKGKGLVTHVLHSKLFRGAWPNATVVVHRMEKVFKESGIPTLSGVYDDPDEEREKVHKLKKSLSSRNLGGKGYVGKGSGTSSKDLLKFFKATRGGTEGEGERPSPMEAFDFRNLVQYTSEGETPNASRGGSRPVSARVDEHTHGHAGHGHTMHGHIGHGHTHTVTVPPPSVYGNSERERERVTFDLSIVAEGSSAVEDEVEADRDNMAVLGERGRERDSVEVCGSREPLSLQGSWVSGGGPSLSLVEGDDAMIVPPLDDNNNERVDDAERENIFDVDFGTPVNETVTHTQPDEPLPVGEREMEREAEEQEREREAVVAVPAAPTVDAPKSLTSMPSSTQGYEEDEFFNDEGLGDLIADIDAELRADPVPVTNTVTPAPATVHVPGAVHANTPPVAVSPVIVPTVTTLSRPSSAGSTSVNVATSFVPVSARGTATTTTANTVTVSAGSAASPEKERETSDSPTGSVKARTGTPSPTAGSTGSGSSSRRQSAAAVAVQEARRTILDIQSMLAEESSELGGPGSKSHAKGSGSGVAAEGSHGDEMWNGVAADLGIEEEYSDFLEPE